MRRVGSNTTGRIFTTGSELKTLLDAVNNRFEQTREEITAAYGHKKITDQFRHRWASLLASWQDFYVEQDNRSFIDPITASAAADEADAYDLERHNLRNDLAKLDPADTPGTDTTVTPPHSDDAVPWYLNLQTLATIAGVGAVAYLALPSLQAFFKRKTAAAPPPVKK